MQLVGKASIVFALAVISPFVVIGFWGMPYLDSEALAATPPGF